MEFDQYIPVHKNRKHIYNKLFDLISSYANVNNYNLINSDIQKIAINLERGVFNWVISNHSSICKSSWNDMFKHYYITRAHTIYMNLDTKNKLGNTELIKRLLNKEINEQQLCSFDGKDMFPSKWQDILNKFGNFEVVKAPEITNDGILKCGRCKSNKTEYVEKITRSADEPTTKFCYCHNCGKRWRFC